MTEIFDVNKFDKKSFPVREKNEKVKRHLKKAIFSYKHLENMLNILLSQEYLKIKETLKDDTNNNNDIWKIFNLLKNPVIMKAVLSNNIGGIKTQDNVKIVDDYFKDNKLMKSAKLMNIDLNAHNISMIVRRVNKDWSNYFLSKEKWFTLGAASGLIGFPSYPKPKKLSKVNKYSIPLEPQNFSLKRKNILSINVFRKQIHTKFTSNEYVNSKTIKSVNISYSNGDIYYNFMYETPKIENLSKTKKRKNIKQAGLDIGVINLASIFVNDENTKSLIVSGNQFISKNCFYNKLISKKQEQISLEVLSFKTIEKENGESVKIPLSYTNKGKRLKKEKSKLIEKRRRFFDDNIHKYSSKILQYLQNNKVTDLVISKNLSFTKTTGEIKMNKKTKQKFYQIPFGRFLNVLSEKSSVYGILIHDKDEAYTSKTSCLSGDVNNNQKKRALNEPILPNDLNGNRGSKGNKLSRGLFKDKVRNVIINADLNGAANHIKLAFPSVRIDKLKLHLSKLQYGIKIKSALEFDNFLNC